ncbi:hypothetical protein [uncultured Ferrimonas sp.]|uniref:hypothetical protein n=1 Tax=uncultured Ferrimonas sp. TaxID=432640 RepID=UPI002612C9E2|nr:hypothetical protein [uncultured Ferrimonas sp.]
MEARLLLVLAIFIFGNLYWGYRYFRAAKQPPDRSIDKQQQLEQISDYWVQFSCVAIILVMLIAPIANTIVW